MHWCGIELLRTIRAISRLGGLNFPNSVEQGQRAKFTPPVSKETRRSALVLIYSVDFLAMEVSEPLRHLYYVGVQSLRIVIWLSHPEIAFKVVPAEQFKKYAAQSKFEERLR